MKTLVHRSLVVTMGFAALVGTSTNVGATPINITGGGVINVANLSGEMVGVTSAPPCIAFSGGSTCTTTPTSISVSGTDPIFGPTATIKDIGTSIPITAFKTDLLVSGPQSGMTAIWDLESIQTPSGFSACTTTTSAGACSTGTFVLTQESTGTVNQVGISFSTNEEGYVGTNATYTLYSGLFTSQLSGTLTQFGCVVSGTQTCTDTIGNIIQFEAAGGTIKSTWSATESPVTATPEPATLGMMGIGSLALGLMGRRRRKS